MPYPDYSGGATGYYQSDPLVDFPQSSTRDGKSDDTRLIFKFSVEAVPNSDPAISNVTIPFRGILYKTPAMNEVEESKSGTIIPNVDLTVANTYKILAFVDPNGNGDLHTYSPTDSNYSTLPTAFAGFENDVNGRGGSLDYEAKPNGSFTTGFGFYKLVSAISINSAGAWTAFTYTPNNLAVVQVCDSGVVNPVIISI